MRYLIVVASLALAGCSGLQWDSGVTWAPDFIKQEQSKPSSIEPEPLPDVAAIVKTQGAKTFSNLQSIQISEPWPDSNHWKLCARVRSLSVTGAPVSGTYTVNVVGGNLRDPRLDTAGVCTKLKYRAPV
jgi:hypothetical protein